MHILLLFINIYFIFQQWTYTNKAFEQNEDDYSDHDYRDHDYRDHGSYDEGQIKPTKTSEITFAEPVMPRGKRVARSSPPLVGYKKKRFPKSSQTPST